MNYEENLLNKIENPDQWPSLEDEKSLNILNKYAKDFYKKNTIEGYLACLLIYHQISEEMIKVLDDCSTFFIQCSIFPLQYKDCIKNKPKKSETYGRYLNKLKNGISNEEIEEFTNKCEKLNRLRNNLFHEIIKNSNLNKMEKNLTNIKKEFEDIFNIFSDIYNNYEVSFSDFKKNIEELKE